MLGLFCLFVCLFSNRFAVQNGQVNVLHEHLSRDSIQQGFSACHFCSTERKLSPDECKHTKEENWQHQLSMICCTAPDFRLIGQEQRIFRMIQELKNPCLNFYGSKNYPSAACSAARLSFLPCSSVVCRELAACLDASSLCGFGCEYHCLLYQGCCLSVRDSLASQGCYASHPSTVAVVLRSKSDQFLLLNISTKGGTAENEI